MLEVGGEQRAAVDGGLKLLVPGTAIGRVISVLLGLTGILFTGVVVAVTVEGIRRAVEETLSQSKQKQG